MRFRKKQDASGSPGIPPVTDDGSPSRSWGHSGQTIIGSHTRIRGTLKGSGPLLIQGSIEGAIDLEGNLVVSAGGCVDAEAEVRSLELCGRASGSMKVSDRVSISSTGRFEGNMATPVLETCPGSVLRGKAVINRPARRTPDE